MVESWKGTKKSRKWEKPQKLCGKVGEMFGQKPENDIVFYAFRFFSYKCDGGLCINIKLHFCVFSEKPHNPMINAGAIITAAMCKPGSYIERRFDQVNELIITLLQ